VIDDGITEKPDTDEDDSVCWNYGHAQKRGMKDINNQNEDGTFTAAPAGQH
jgi:D-hexose-6-phosphate mutarotase